MVAEYSVWQQGVEVNYAALCEEKKDGLHILRLMGQTSVVYIPQMIDGYEVKVIGEYCFLPEIIVRIGHQIMTGRRWKSLPETEE